MSVAYLRNVLSGKKRELQNYHKRKSQLEGMKSGYSSFDGYASELNRCRRNVVSAMESAIKISGGSNNPYGMWSGVDYGNGDGNLSNSMSYTNQEIRRVEQKIAELNSEIGRLNTSIEREKAREKAEEEKKRQQG